jgi:hypothetical protein
MNFKTKLERLLSNKTFLYVIMALSVTNVLGYLVMNKLNAVMFFILLGLLVYQFNKNLAVVLLVPLILVNFLLVTPIGKEGFETSKDKSNTSQQNKTTGQGNAYYDDEINHGVDAMQNNKDFDDAKKAIEANKNKPLSTDSMPITPPHDPNNTDLNQGTQEQSPEGFTGKNKKTGSRLDAAASMEEAYDNLEKMLGQGGIQNLTTDTRKLMAQQEKLFTQMENMMPMVQQAQGFLKNMGINSSSDLNKFAAQFGQMTK